MINSISAVIITKNAANTLKNTLESLREFSEVIILDNGSTDETLLIAKEYSNVILTEGTFEGFGSTKNKAVTLANNDWVFSLDADEVVSTRLLESLRKWPIDTQINHYGTVLRENLFMGKSIHRGGWGNDKLVRLFNRTSFQFNKNQVHESVQVDGSSTSILVSGILAHDAVQDIGQFLIKVNRYSELRCKELLAKNIVPSLLTILIKVHFAFFRSYFLQLGFLDGWRGLVIAYSNANGVFFKYMKAYAIKHHKSDN
jgi:glycosyltransferase involved in cell wall biosynthesis